MRSIERERWQRRSLGGEGAPLPRSLSVLAAALALAACAGSSPQTSIAAADASESATAPRGSTAAAPADGATDAAPTPTENPDASNPDVSVAEPPAEPAATEIQPAPDAAAAGADPASEAAAEAEAAETPPPVAEQAAVADTGAADYLPASPPGSGLASGRPYVVIRFARTNIDYEAALAAAVEKAVARRPNVAFDLVAVAPPAGSAEEEASRTAVAEAQAAQVLQTLAGLGFGPDRVSLQPWTGEASAIHEIRLYIR